MERFTVIVNHHLLITNLCEEIIGTQRDLIPNTASMNLSSLCYSVSLWD